MRRHFDAAKCRKSFHFSQNVFKDIQVKRISYLFRIAFSGCGLKLFNNNESYKIKIFFKNSYKNSKNHQFRCTIDEFARNCSIGLLTLHYYYFY